MKILHTADWHLGTFRSPVKDGVNLRTEDTKRCLDELIRVANEEKPDYSIVSGDIFHVGRLWSDRCCEEIITAIHYIRELAAVSKQVVVMRGTPNHDGSGQFNVLSEMFADVPNVHVVITPQVISFDDVDIAVLPGFDRGVFRANHPGLSSDEENVVFTNELSNIVTGLKAQCSPEKKSILMAHYTVPGCNTESGQTMMLTQFEPIIPQEALLAANYNLVALGHIHRPQKIMHRDWYYSGAINAMNFNDEGQQRGFWIHNWHELGTWQSIFHEQLVHYVEDRVEKARSEGFNCGKTQAPNMFKELPLHTVISRKELLDAMVRAKMCTAEKCPVKFELSGSQLNLSIKDQTTDYHETVDLQEDISEELTIGFDARLVIETLKAFDCDNVGISLQGPKMPMIVEAEDSDFKTIVLPVAIK